MNIIVNTIIGIILALIGAFINNFGLVLQKRQVNIKSTASESKGLGDLGQYFKDPLWILGILMQTFIYLPFLVLAFDFLGITLVQPISNGGVIFLVLGLIILVNEKLKNTSEYLGVIILIFGVIIIALGGVIGDITVNIILTYIFNFWMIILVILIFSLICFALVLKFKRIRPMMLGLIAGNSYAFVAVSLQLFTSGLAEINHPWSLILIIGGFSGAVIGTVTGILSTQEAFKRSQAIHIIPFSQLTMNIIPIIAGIVVFQQVIQNQVFFWIGVVSIIVGATLLARYFEERPKEEK
ncbi:MAG: hypothetical protein EAX96_17735 [Candidatus Lokiarchaeota archaeon]|nr:hypothetical protein [Candidatus Lokiarchaeota archaeon]